VPSLELGQRLFQDLKLVGAPDEWLMPVSRSRCRAKRHRMCLLRPIRNLRTTAARAASVDARMMISSFYGF
jgi:hypothetical protein